MGQMAVGIGGAVLGGVAGFFIGGPAGVLAGAGLGFSIGGMVGSVLFPVKGPTVYGSRIGDLTITASTYGVMRPVVYGNAQVAGNVIWGTPIKEISTSTQVGGGGKGGGMKGGGGTQVQYTYTATFALALCQGPVEQIVRIWMNGAVVYDLSAGFSSPVGTNLNDPLAEAVSSAHGATTSANSPVNFRFYPGTTTQLPDSLIEADKGVGNVPAYRGLCYLVFDSLLLTNFGDRIPNIQVEVTTSAVESNTFQELERGEFTPNYQMVLDSAIGSDVIVRQGQAGYFGYIPGPGHPTQENVLEVNLSLPTGQNLSITYSNATVPPVFTSYSPYSIAINPLTLLGYIWGISPTGIVEFDLQTMNVISEYTLDYIMGTYNTYDSLGIVSTCPLWIGYDQYLYGLIDSNVFKVNPATMQGGVALYLGNDDNVGSPFASNIANMGGPLGLIGPSGVENYTVVGGGNMGGGFPNVKVVELGTYLTTTSSPASICPGQFGSMIGAAYILGLSSTNIFVDQIVMSVTVGVSLTGPTYSRNLTIANVMLLAATTVYAAATGWEYVTSACFDPADNSIVFSGQVSITSGAGPSFFMKMASNGSLIYATPYPYGVGVGASAEGSNPMSDLREGTFAVFCYDGHIALQFDLATGAIIGNFPWVLTQSGGQVYSGAFNAILMASSGPFVWDKIVVGLLSNVPLTLATVATGVCESAGLLSSDINVTGLAEIPFDGFAISNRTTGSNILKPLMDLYQIDVVENDYTLVFQPRGGSVVATIPQDSMIRPDTGSKSNDQSEPYTEVRIQEMDMPMRYTVSYIDETVQYQANTQMAKRTVFPNRSMYSDQQIDLQVGLVMTPQAAAQQAELLLYALWSARHSFKVTLPPDFMWLNPADPVTLTLDNGFTMRGRIGPFDTGLNMASECTIIGETDGQYTSTAPGQAGDIPPNTVPYFVSTKFFLLDTPLLRDVDDTAGTALRAYWAATPYAAGTWPAAQLQGSPDDDVWSALDIEVNEAAYGVIEGVLPDAIGCMHVREGDFIIVRVAQGGASLSSCTYTQLANGSNAAVVFKANGDVEVIGYLAVTALPNSRYQLFGIARGQRGTDTMAAGHLVGETILFLSTGTVDPISLPLSARGNQGFYRAVTAGTLPAAAPTQTQVFHGRDQMPYAPVQVAAAISGSNIVLTWNRRARVNGGLIESVGTVPVGEVSESYSIDIYNSGGTAVLRTLTATSPTVTYTAAEITTDFGSTPATLNVSVYQISGTVGRGFARLDTLVV